MREGEGERQRGDGWGKKPYRRYNRFGALEDPWVSLTDHSDSSIHDGVLYGKNSSFLSVKSYSMQNTSHGVHPVIHHEMTYTTKRCELRGDVIFVI